MITELGQRISDFLAAHHVMSLATLGAGGPHATSLFYACEGLTLIWLSQPDSQHSQDIEACSNVAATVAPDYTDFAEIRGVQMAGAAHRIVATDERIRCLAQLKLRYSFLGQLATGPSKLQQAYAQADVYRLQPTRIALIDNTRGFGHKEVLDIHLQRLR